MKRSHSKPNIILLSGITGSGKSTILDHLRNFYSHTIVVGKKITNRKKRPGDNSWEFDFVDEINDGDYVYGSVGSYYGILKEDIIRTHEEKKIYVISCTDRHTVEKLQSDFNCLVIYVHRHLDEADFKQLMEERAITDSNDLSIRFGELKSALHLYADQIDLFDHVILNTGTLKDLYDQITKLLLAYDCTNTAWS